MGELHHVFNDLNFMPMGHSSRRAPTHICRLSCGLGPHLCDHIAQHFHGLVNIRRRGHAHVADANDLALQPALAHSTLSPGEVVPHNVCIVVHTVLTRA